MNEESGVDFSELVSKIMARPDLVAELTSLAEEKPAKEAPPQTAQKAPPPEVETAASTDNTAGIRQRHALFGALKPYLSDGRAKLLDSMGAVLDMMETVGRRS